MNRHTSTLLALLATTWIASTASAQFYPAPPPPYPGLINNNLRTSDPYMSRWDIGVNIRGRSENKDDAGFTSAGSNKDFFSTGSGNLSDNNNSYFITRIMPRIGYTDKWYTAFIQLRSSSSFDDERENNTSVPLGSGTTLKSGAFGKNLPENDHDLNVHQAYLMVGNHKEFPISAKVGRQELSYGEQRSVGAFLWNNNARTFDAVKVRYQNAWIGADVFAGGVVYNDDSNFNTSHPQDDLFSGVYLNFPKISSKEIVEAYLYNRDVDASSASVDQTGAVPYSGVAAPFRNPAKQDLYTAGLRIKSKPDAYGPWDYSAELMHQFGNMAETGPTAASGAVAAAQRKEVDAYAAILQGGYTWTESPYQPRLALIYSYASGDKSSTDGKVTTFQNLFATTHMFYGYMDLNSLQNLHDIRLAYTLKPTAKTRVALEGHLQYLDKSTDSWYNVAGVGRAGGVGANAHNGYGRNGAYSRDLGEEIDFIFSYTPVPYTNIELGLSHYFAGNYIEDSLSGVGGAKDASYAYAQVTFNL